VGKILPCYHISNVLIYCGCSGVIALLVIKRSTTKRLVWRLVVRGYTLRNHQTFLLSTSYRVLILHEDLYVCTFVCLYACMFVRFYVCTFVCLYPCIFVRLYVCTFVCLYFCMFVRLYVCTLVCLYVCMFVSSYVCTFVCLYICVFVSLYICTNLSRVSQLLPLSVFFDNIFC
jgi:hypothetical protein